MTLDNQLVAGESLQWEDPLKRTHFDLKQDIVVLAHGWNDSTGKLRKKNSIFFNPHAFGLAVAWSYGYENHLWETLFLDQLQNFSLLSFYLFLRPFLK